ncbi:hypothetical protein N7G274_000134 [Stereocaulon virgatum]|uniref:Uncharacterized protein n=1 Tax=Stereocaulon virgatum TaxID=373712 RepID=A0ABR4ARA5_9LECA
MQYYYQTDLYNIKSPNRKAQAIKMMGNNTSTTVAEDTPSSISAPGRRVSSILSAGSRSNASHSDPGRKHSSKLSDSRNSSSSPAGSRRPSSRLNSASTTVEPEVQVQAPAPIAQMFPARPNLDHLTAPMDPIGMTPLQIWNTVPNAIMGPRAAALAMAANPPSVPAPEPLPSTRDHILNEEDEYHEEAEVGDEETANDEEEDSDLEQHINDFKQHRDSLILELMRVQAAAAAAAATDTFTTANKSSTTTTHRRQPGRKAKKSELKFIERAFSSCSCSSSSVATITASRRGLRMHASRRYPVVVSEDVPARNTRSRRAGRGGAEFGFGELEVVLRRMRGGRGSGKEVRG